MIKKRHASLAVLFSIISPGMGHLYAGKWKLAIALPFILFLLIALVGWTRVVFLSEGMSIIVMMIAVFYLLVMASSFLLARKPTSHNLNASQKWYFYILFLVVVSLVNSMVMEYRGKLFGFEPFRIPAASMLPTIMVNDLLIVDTWAYKKNEPELGDVVVFDYPRDPKVKYIKRIMAKGGDHLAYYDKVLHINGKPLRREFVRPYITWGVSEKMEEYSEYIGEKQYRIALMPLRPAINAEYIVPEGYYFVMGDNRDDSNDSRYWGVLPHHYLYGKAEYIWFSIGNDMNLRSGRMGIRF